MTRSIADRSAPGPLGPALERRLADFRAGGAARRLWEKDASLWKADPAAQKRIKQRLGWLGAPATYRAKLGELKALEASARADGLRRAVLLGMGGSSLAAEVFARSFPRPGGLELRTLDSTDPAAVRAAVEGIAPEEALYLVASKSGTTTEVDSFYRHFRQAVKDPSRFAAVTDPGTPLEALARKEGFRAVLVNRADIGGRYSALSFFGLAPAALLGLDLGRLLDGAAEEARACAPSVPAEDNPGLLLGAALGEAALAGRDKLVFLAAPELAPLFDWIEQLVAESTGKEGKGLVPVLGRPEEEAGGPDRLYVELALAGSKDRSAARAAERLEKAGQPVLRHELAGPYALSAAFFRWEFATAVAGAVLGIDPFDEPNVTESKDLTKELLAGFERDGRLDAGAPAWEGGGLALWSDPGLKAGGDAAARARAHLARAKPGDYLALLAYLPPDARAGRALEALRDALARRTGLPVTTGWGPRFLHSTGQLHKGGPATGVFLQFTSDSGEDLPVPGRPWTFQTLKLAQALGDYKALARRGRRVLRLHSAEPAAGLEAARAAVEGA